MDRGIPTGATLEQMRHSDPPVSYLVGTTKGKFGALEAELAGREWQQARPSVRVKLLPRDGETYVLAQSQDRIAKERAMRRRRLRKLIARLKELQEQRPSYEALLLKLGAAKSEAGREWSLLEIALPARPSKKAERRERIDFTFKLDKQRLRIAWRREGRYLLPTNLTETDPAKLWEFYLQLEACNHQGLHYKPFCRRLLGKSRVPAP